MDQVAVVEFVVIVGLVLAIWNVWWTGSQSLAAAVKAERERGEEAVRKTAAGALDKVRAAESRRDELIGQLDTLGQEADQLRRENLALKASTPPTPPATMSAEDREKAKANTCVHCGGIHAVACPRVKSMRFRGDGSVFAVEFWPDNEWPKDRVLFLEDYAEPGVPQPPEGS